MSTLLPPPRRDDSPRASWYSRTIAAIHRGHTRGLIAAIFVVTLILLLFHSPGQDKKELVAAMRTLSVAVLAFYFGSRTAERRTPGSRD